MDELLLKLYKCPAGIYTIEKVTKDKEKLVSCIKKILDEKLFWHYGMDFDFNDDYSKFKKIKC